MGDRVAGGDTAVAVNCVVGAPAWLGECFLSEFRRAAMAGAVIELHPPQIVLVSSLQMDDLPENALAHHIQYGHYIPAITNVLQHHDMRLVLFGCFHHIPVFLQGDAEDHFRSDIFNAGGKRSEEHTSE